MENTVNNLSFLRSKIETIRTALFKTEYNYREGIPNNIIHTLQTDEEGNVWFCTSVAKNYMAKPGEQFYAYLEYHHKGSDSSLRISGMATIVDNDNVAESASTQEGTKYLLVKLKMINAEYYEYAPKEPTSLFSFKQLFSNLMFTSTKERYFDFS